MSKRESAAAAGGDDAPSGLFRHREHVKLAWMYLRKYTLLEAVVKVSESLGMFAVLNGGEYNETLTWAYMFLINERMLRMGEDDEWDEFARANPDLFDWERNILKNYYREETLESDLAKRVFILPDLCGQRSEKRKAAKRRPRR
jgi:hypothetical protein